MNAPGIKMPLSFLGLVSRDTHVGPLPLPPWLSLVLRDGHRVGLTYALWATGLWLDRSISKHWSLPRRGPWPGGQSAFAMILAFMALAFGLIG